MTTSDSRKISARNYSNVATLTRTRACDGCGLGQLATVAIALADFHFLTSRSGPQTRATRGSFR